MKNPKIVPRPYQVECLAAISQAVATGAQRALVVMASGLGKTLTSAFAIKEFFKDRSFGRVLILCHSEAILSQSKDKYKSYFGEEYSYGMFTGQERATRQTDFLFATFQTMKEHRKEFTKGAFTYVVVDEAHHSHAHTYFPTIKYFDPEFLLGLTATPDRLDGQDIEEIYGAPVYQLDFIEAMSRGLLAECDYQLVLDDMSQEKLNECLESGERLSITQLNRTVFVPKRDEEIVRLIRQYSAEQQDPKTIIFCKTIEHARRIAKMMGEDVVVVHNRQGKLTNDMALEAFRQGKIRAIVSVQMLNEGIDVPDANVIVFLRNTVSETIFYQQLGRGTRLSPGKDKVKVLDFVANCERIQAVLELKQDFDDFKLQQPVTDAKPHGAGDADSREKFTLNIATSEFKASIVDIAELLGRVHCVWTKEKIVEALQKESIDGFMPSIQEIDSNPSLPSRNIIRQHFKNQHEAAAACGLKMKTTFNQLSDETMLNMFYEYAVSLGHWPTLEEMREADKGMPRIETYRSRFKCRLIDLPLLIIQKGYDCSMIGGLKKWSKDLAIENFKKLILEKRHKPTRKDVDACSYLPKSHTLIGIIGCGINALYEVCHGDELLGITGKETEREPIDASMIDQMCKIVKQNKRKLIAEDLRVSKGLRYGYTWLRKKGWDMKALNELIDADAILAELSN